MVELDEVDERERRNEFMSSVSDFMLAVKNIAEVAPPMMPVALEMLKFVVRGFAVGRSLEASIEDAADQIKKQMAAPKPPPPPTTEEVKLKVAQEQFASEERIAKAHEEAETDRTELEQTVKLQIAGLGGQIELVALEKEALDAAEQGEVEHQRAMQLQAQVPLPGQPPQGPPGMMPMPQRPPMGNPLIEAQGRGHAQTQAILSKLMEAVNQPRVHTPVRGPDGLIQHSISKPAGQA
jgi:hypothetical protein